MVGGYLLVVDDDEASRDALSRRLRQHGYAVTVAADGDEAVPLVQAGDFDLVVVNVEMPGVNGLELLAALRKTHSQTELPIIMVTSRSRGDHIVEAFRLGANDYLTEPIDFPVAVARIGTHLSHKTALEQLRESEERYALAMRGANDGLWDWNLGTNEVFWSARWKAMLGYEETELGAGPDEWLSRVHQDDVAGVKEALAKHLENGAGHYESEHRVLHRNGTYRWVLCRGAAIRNEAGIATRLAGSLTDITESKVADALTGLPNRLLFDELLDRAIKRADRRANYLFALLVLGLDRFSAVNASLGRPAADRLLVAVARRLQTSLRSTDAVARSEQGFTLARLGGDEFTVLLDDITDASDAVRVAERLRAALEKPFEVDGQMVFASASVGIAVSATGYERPEDILRDAVIALHRAKTEGPSRCELFDTAMRERAVARLKIETELRRALESRSFEVHYQPIVSLATGGVAGFEALIRWRDPVRGLLSPAEFIGIAEDTGLILQMGRLVLSESCRQMAEWLQRFGAAAPGVLCVNVSSRQFADSELPAYIGQILEQTGLDPSRLELEITESAFLRDLAAARLALTTVRSMGVKWSLDDFGTGYSSLSYLHMLPVSTIKIDRAFVSRLGGNDNGPVMVRAIVTLAHSLGMKVVAEGVETFEQIAQLRMLGCEHAQGFYFSKAAGADRASELIATQPWRTQEQQTGGVLTRSTPGVMTRSAFAPIR